MYMRLIRYVSPRWGLTVSAFLLIFACVLLGLCQPYLISRFIDDVLIGKDSGRLLPILAVSFLLTLSAAGCTTAGFTIFRYLEARNMLDMRKRILAHIRKIPLPEIEKHGAGKFTALMGMDTDKAAKFINVTAIELARQWLQMLASMVIIFAMDWRLGLIAAAAVPVVMWIPGLFKKPVRSTVSELRSHNEDIGAYLYESIQGSREIRTYGLEEWEEGRNETMYRNLVRVSVREGLYRMLSGQTGALVIALTVVFIYGIGSSRVMADTISVGFLVAAVQYIYNVLNPVQSMNYLISDLMGSQVAMGRIEEFLRTPVEQLAQERMEEHEGAKIPAPSLYAPYVECRELRVVYDGTVILKGIHLEVQKGQVAAFVGRSGSGKSTLFKTLQGFMPAASGQVFINRVPLSHWSRSGISRTMSFVSQETFLFKGTLFENVALGKLDATEAEVYQALCEVDLKSFVDGLPEGIHTSIDNQGFRLSGGQRQRLAIARAIIKQPEILILDEPTSSLDRKTEEQVLETIGRVMRGKTTFISTHRLESIRSADIIYVMDQGEIVDCGTHAELMQRCGIYTQLVKMNELLQETATA
jgi:ABC-type multidrug transport system fused ATPase/permease subunit